GTDVTSQFTFNQNGTVITATMTDQALAAARSLATPMQYTLLIGGKANYANGKGAAQVRADAGKKSTDEVEFCADPTTGTALDSHGLLNKASETAAGKTKSTNQPYVCGYVPPVEKAVISEASQGGDQDDINGKSVMPGQKLEYELNTNPTIPNNLGYDIETVAFTDTYDKYLELDKQTIELRDLTTGRTISKKNYTLS
ncbi:cell-wall protein, partial [Alloscardovia venturai]